MNMKSTQKTLLVITIVVALCGLLVAVVTASPAKPNSGNVDIEKTVVPRTIQRGYDGVLTYTISLTNEGGMEMSARRTMSDRLPIGLEFVAWVTTPPTGTEVVDDDTIMWTGDIEYESTLQWQFTVQLPDPGTPQDLLGDKIVNTAELGRIEEGTFVLLRSASATTEFFSLHYIFLPLVMRSAPTP